MFDDMPNGAQYSTIRVATLLIGVFAAIKIRIKQTFLFALSKVTFFK